MIAAREFFGCSLGETFVVKRHERGEVQALRINLAVVGCSRDHRCSRARTIRGD